MRRDSFIFSGVLHVVAILLAIFGLPIFLSEPPIDEQPIVVDIVPLGDKTNPPPKQNAEAQPEPPKPEEKPEQPKPEPAKPVPPPPAPPPPAPPPPAPPPPAPPPPPKPEPAPVPPPPKPEPKPEPPKPESPPPKPEAKPKQKPQEELDSLFKSVDKLKPKPATDSKDKTKDMADLMKALDTVDKTDKAKPSDTGKQAKPQNVKGSDSNNPNEPVSMTELDMIRAQIYKCWNPPIGAKDAADLIVSIHVALEPDGRVSSADIVPSARYATDSFYRAAADSARRAVLLCSPLKAPPTKYDQWKDLTLRFNPKDLVGLW